MDSAADTSMDRTFCLMDCPRCANLDELLEARQEQDILIDQLKEDKTQLENTVIALETEMCQMRKGVRMSEDDSEDLLRNHVHCTSDTCWRQKYCESLLQLRSALVNLKDELESQESQTMTCSKDADIRIIEESLRSIVGPMLNPHGVKRNLNELSGRHVKISRFNSTVSRESRDSRSSITRGPFLKRMMNLFRKNRQQN